ncbi:hypothetical protein DY000_02016448 [Brassica cretica]|uniref:Uncharacterized protein n=1 Tax=Brassica cretica TaxID=69181 RepID=A0ABQ7D382_BRACR|nr:hypothetical protein DY000_02016448 [Brassica cretica]
MPTSFMTGSIVGKRFYKKVMTREADDGNGWTVMLDYRTLKTPSMRPLKLPSLIEQVIDGLDKAVMKMKMKKGEVALSGEASASFVNSGGTRAIVRWSSWELLRVFLETLIKETGCEVSSMKLLYMHLSDRKPVEKEDEIIVMVVPGYKMLEYVEKIAKGLADDPVTKL